MSGVTREQAEAVLAAIVARWNPADWPGGIPKLYGHRHEDLPRGCWSIAWEGGSPQDWAVLLSDGDAVPGVFLEPIFSFVLGIYPIS